MQKETVRNQRCAGTKADFLLALFIGRSPETETACPASSGMKRSGIEVCTAGEWDATKEIKRLQRIKMIELWNVNKTYETGNKALRNINITVEDGEFVFIIGRSGSGKSTLLNALELGVYNHIAGDGREYVIADETAQKLRSEDGRFIKNVDISMFINDLPNGRDTKDFSTADASGSTSQAAGIVEAVEAGSRLLLLDEDTSATNFMVRDAFMQKVVSPDKEPITPFLSRAVDLYEKAGISTILVAGSSGAFFHIADTVIQMDQYEPVDITEKAKNLCGQFPIMQETAKPFVLPDSHRVMEKDRNGAVKRRDYRSGEVKKGEPERLKVKTLGVDGFMLGKQNVDLRYIEQLIDSEQTAALGLLLKYTVEHLVDGKRTISETAQWLEHKLEQEGMVFAAEHGVISGGYAIPRIQEIYSCLNRYRV